MRAKDGLLSLVKGVIVGISTLIPSLSCASISISVEIYEPFINSVKNIFKRPNRKLYLITIPALIGILAGLFSGTHLINFLLSNYKAQIIFFFIGLLAGGYRMLIKKNTGKTTSKSAIIFFIAFIISILIQIIIVNKITISVPDNIFITLGLGLLTGVILLIPGLNETVILSLTGNTHYLSSLLKTQNLTSYLEIFLFILSAIIGVIIITKIIYKAFKKYKNQTYAVLSAFLLSSIVGLVLQLDKFTVSFVNVFTIILTFLWGYILCKNLAKE